MIKSKLFKILPPILLAATLFLSGCAGGQTQEVSSGTGIVSALITIDSIETSGSLSAAQLAALTWNTSGIVEKVNVQAGQQVKSGEVLAILKTASVSADILTAQSNLAAAQQALDELMDTTSDLATAQLAVANAQSAVDDAQKEFDSLYFPRASDALIKYTEAQIAEAKLNVAAKADRYREVQNKPDGDPTKTEAKLAWSNAQLELNTLLGKYAWYTGTPSETDVAVAKATLENAQATLAAAQKEYEKLQAGPDPVDVAQAEANLAAAQAQVNQMAVIAPFDGVILTVQTAAGNPVESGDAAFEMVNRNTIQIEAQVDETSISSVAVGNTAEITLDLLPDLTLTGHVATISSIGTTVNGLVKYTVTIALDPTEQPVRFGATANVVINTSEPHTVLAVPINAIQTDSQGEYVTLIKSGGLTERIAVESGDLSGGLATITAAGLNEGDQVLLGATTTTDTTSSGSNNSGNNGAGGPPDGGIMPMPGGPGGM